MNIENLFGTETITYGFDSMTQDDFCTAVLVLLGIIAVTLFIIAVKGNKR